MEFFDVVIARRSIRSFAPVPVEGEKLQRILESANRAPSAGNLQAYEIYIVKSLPHKTALARAALDQEFVADAPVVLVFCAHPARSEWRYHERGVWLYSLQDATIACTFAILAVTALGLASVWVGAFDEEAARRVIGAPQGILPVSILPIGYPAEKPKPATRRRLPDFVHKVAD